MLVAYVITLLVVYSTAHFFLWPPSFDLWALHEVLYHAASCLKVELAILFHVVDVDPLVFPFLVLVTGCFAEGGLDKGLVRLLWWLARE